MTRIALVTGASSGLGREFVKRIDAGQAGPIDEIWVVARRAERLEALVRTCSTTVRPFCLDLTQASSFQMLEDSLTQTREPVVSLMVNNAGFGTFGPLAEQKADDTTNMIKLLVQAPVELMYRTLPYMMPVSRIINIASVAAFLPQPKLAVYSASKRFLLDISRSLNAELSSTGITVTAVCPKFMETEFLDRPGDEQAAANMTVIGFEKASNVARRALRDSSRGKDLCIPSWDMRAYHAAAKVLPYRVALAAERALGIK